MMVVPSRVTPQPSLGTARIWSHPVSSITLFRQFSAGNDLLSKMRKMRTLSDDDEVASTSSGSSKGDAPSQPAWMRSLLQHCQEWLGVLPAVRVLSYCPLFSYLTTTSSHSISRREMRQTIKIPCSGSSVVKIALA